jgi:NAD(P)-dependent dehydrogenase (short-subunit alcohol dehydrogenase family)
MEAHDSITNKKLSGQVALVTGGGRGLGREVAKALAAAGISVAICARSTDPVNQTAALIDQAGGRALAFSVDVTDQNAVESMISRIQQTLGPIDLLVNNAAVVSPIAPVWEVDPDQWWRLMDINLRGPFICARSVLPGMIERRQGRIINVSSGAGMETVANWTAYITSKAALIKLSEVMAAETRAYGISVFSIDPGPVLTSMTEHVMRSEEGKRWMPEFRRIFDEGRDVPPDRVAALTLFIASGQADALSGCYISVSHDIREMVRQADLIRKSEQYTLRLNL